MSNLTATIETTSCETVLRILQRDPAIKWITEILDNELKLETVGDLMQAGEVEKVRALFAEKKLRHYSNGHGCRIHPKNAVRCLRLDYIYLMKDLRRVYL